MTIAIYSVVEDMKRALNSVLSEYFVGGKTKYINGVQLKFPDCTVYYDIRELETDTDNKNPIIAIVGSRSNKTNYKCGISPNTGFVSRIKTPRTVYVKVLNIYPLTDQNGNNVTSYQWADSTWGLLNAVFSTKKTEFISVGIENINFTSTPDDASNEQETLLIGNLSFEADVFSYKE